MIRPQIVVLLLVLTFNRESLAKSTNDNRCFDMKPISNFDDGSCGPVKVRIQFKDCSNGTTINNPIEAISHFDCHTNPPKLKYWYRNAMLFADLRKTDDSYEIVKTYAVTYGKNKKEDQDISLNAPVVLPPSAVAAPAPAPAPVVAPVSDAAAVSSGAVAGADSLANDALKAKALAELSEPTQNVAADSSAASVPPSAAAGVAGAPPVVVADASPAPSPSPPVTAEQPPPVQVTSAGKALLEALSKVQVGASVSAFYSYNFNVPSSTTTPVSLGQPPTATNVYLLPNAYHDQLTLALARVSVYEDPSPVGFRADLGFGPLTGFINNGSDASTENLLQGYLSYKLPFNLVIDAGKFYSNLGFENVDPALNWNYSYSYLFRYLTPNWSSGVRATMPVGDKIGLGVYLTNGPNSFYNVHRTRDIGGQIRVSPIDSLKVILNYLNGDEGQAAYSDIRTTYEGIALYTPIDSLKIAADYVFSQENGGATASLLQATSIVVSANYNFWNRFFIIPRYEILNDGGVSWGTGSLPAPALPLNPGGQMINAVTVGLEYRPDDNFRLQAEFRQDQSNQNPFANSSGPTGSQSAATLSAMVIY